MSEIKTMTDIIWIKPVVRDITINERAKARSMILLYGINKMVTVVEYRDRMIYEYVLTPKLVHGKIYTLKDVLTNEFMARGINAVIMRNAKIIKQNVVRANGKTIYIIQLLRTNIDGIKFYVTRVIENTPGKSGLSNGKIVIAISTKKTPYDEELKSALWKIEKWINA